MSGRDSGFPARVRAVLGPTNTGKTHLAIERMLAHASGIIGFPLRLLCPRYYGFKNVKWMREIAFVSKPYYGTWPKMGYTKEPVVKIASFIDKAKRDGNKIRVGGVSYAGSRGIQAVEVRVGGGKWMPATMEKTLSPYTWTRWVAELENVPDAATVEARAQDGTGAWQLEEETPLFPSGVGGPTVRKLSS